MEGRGGKLSNYPKIHCPLAVGFVENARIRPWSQPIATSDDAFPASRANGKTVASSSDSEGAVSANKKSTKKAVRDSDSSSEDEIPGIATLKDKAGRERNVAAGEADSARNGAFLGKLCSHPR